MQKKQEVSTPVYRRIAIDIAKDISGGRYGKGQKLFGRSVLASQYGVSPETIRKAVFLLKDVGILETEKGSGIDIISTEKATEFIERHSEVENIDSIKNEITGWIQEQAQQTAQILGKIQLLVNTAGKLNTISPLNPYQIKIEPHCQVIGKTVSDVQFWHNTGGTIIAIRRGENLVVSPGPYATFCEGDIFFIVGDAKAYSACINLLFN